MPHVNPTGNRQCQVTGRGCPSRHHIHSCHLSPTARGVTDTLTWSRGEATEGILGLGGMLCSGGRTWCLNSHLALWHVDGRLGSGDQALKIRLLSLPLGWCRNTTSPGSWSSDPTTFAAFSSRGCFQCCSQMKGWRRMVGAGISCHHWQ